MDHLIAAIDQGTTSSRCILYGPRGAVGVGQREHRQIYPRAGWVEHDPTEIWDRVQAVVAEAIDQAGARDGQIAAVGITNQRETVVAWDRRTGRPLCNAIVWQDTRTAPLCADLARDGGPDRLRPKTGLPLATYFSGPKIRWMLDNVPGLRALADTGHALVGTIDSWLIWNLTGGVHGGQHVTDVTNASRTLLMDLRTLDWDADLLQLMSIPRPMLPRILPSASRDFGQTLSTGPFRAAIPISGVLGDQQAALVGQDCLAEGQSKNTYGTGCFMLLNTGTKPVPSQHGLLTTVAYQFAGQPAVYALEGSVAVAGALVQWLRDNLNVIGSSADVEPLARSVPDNGGVYFVPAFSGLFAPYWRADARGTLVGMTQHTTKAHIARAALEATAFQTLDVLHAMHHDSGVRPTTLKVDGGMAANSLLMQFQADLLDLPVVRPHWTETTSLGAARAAATALGMDLAAMQGSETVWQPKLSARERAAMHRCWKKAVERAMGWVDEKPE